MIVGVQNQACHYPSQRQRQRLAGWRTPIADNYGPLGEHYHENGYSGFYAGNLSIWPSFMDGYAATRRLYHYDQGRWVSPDPAGLAAVDFSNPQSWNRYAYVMNNPLSNMDPSGMYNDCSGGICSPFSDPSGQPGCYYNYSYWARHGRRSSGTICNCTSRCYHWFSGA